MLEMGMVMAMVMQVVTGHIATLQIALTVLFLIQIPLAMLFIINGYNFSKAVKEQIGSASSDR